MSNEVNGDRQWAMEALRIWRLAPKAFLLSACPGAGKTRFAAKAIKSAISADPNLLVVCVVPTDALKKQWAQVLSDHEGVQLCTTYKPDSGLPRGFNGICVTYHQLPGIELNIRLYSHQGRKVMFVLDEIHHCGEDYSWGCAVQAIGAISSRILSLTGTPFRSDGTKIPFVNYCENGHAIPDYTYSYSRGITESVNRRVEFRLIDCKVDRYDEKTKNIDSQQLSDCDEKVTSWLRSALDPDMDLARNIIVACWENLQRMIAAGDRSAACGLHCLPSLNSGGDMKYINRISKMVQEITGTTPTVVYHEMPDCTERIEQFKNSKRESDKFLISIKQFSEGVDIPRCRVGGYLSNVIAPLSLVQTIGRYTRYEKHKSKSQYAVFVMANIPQFIEFATLIEKEVKVGLDEKKTKERAASLEFGDIEKVKNRTITMGVEALGESVIMSGDQFDETSSDLATAKRIECMFPSLPIGDLARVIAESKRVENENEYDVPSSSAPVALLNKPSLETQMKEWSKRCHAIANKIYNVQIGSGDYDSIAEVNNEVNKRQGIPRGHGVDWLRRVRGIAGLEQRLEILGSMLERYQVEDSE